MSSLNGVSWQAAGRAKLHAGVCKLWSILDGSRPVDERRWMRGRQRGHLRPRHRLPSLMAGAGRPGAQSLPGCPPPLAGRMSPSSGASPEACTSAITLCMLSFHEQMLVVTFCIHILTGDASNIHVCCPVPRLGPGRLPRDSVNSPLYLMQDSSSSPVVGTQRMWMHVRNITESGVWPCILGARAVCPGCGPWHQRALLGPQMWQLPGAYLAACRRGPGLRPVPQAGHGRHSHGGPGGPAQGLGMLQSQGSWSAWAWPPTTAACPDVDSSLLAIHR